MLIILSFDGDVVDDNNNDIALVLAIIQTAVVP